MAIKKTANHCGPVVVAAGACCEIALSTSSYLRQRISIASTGEKAKGRRVPGTEDVMVVSMNKDFDSARAAFFTFIFIMEAPTPRDRGHAIPEPPPAGAFTFCKLLSVTPAISVFASADREACCNDCSCYCDCILAISYYSHITLYLFLVFALLITTAHTNCSSKKMWIAASELPSSS